MIRTYGYIGLLMLLGCNPATPSQQPANQAVVSDTVHADTTALPIIGADSMQAVTSPAADSTQQVTAPTSATPDTTSALNLAAQTANEIRTWTQNLFWKIIQSLILIVLAYYLIRGVVYVLEILAERNVSRRLFFKRLIPILRILLWTLVLFTIVYVVIGLRGGELLAALGAGGISVAFAAQDIFKNIIGGFVIITDQPFQVGDKISVGGTYGEVVSIGLRSTRIVTPDDNLVSVPNAQVVDGQVSNANAGELDCQVVTDLYLPGWVDVMKAKEIAYQAATNSRYVYLGKPIVVIVKDEFRETFLTHLKVKAYVLDTRYEFLLMSDITEAAKMEFLKHNMLYPVPPPLDMPPPSDKEV